MPDGEDTEQRRSNTQRSKGEAMGVCKKEKSLELMSMRDCESNRAVRGGTNLRVFVIQNLKDKARGEAE